MKLQKNYKKYVTGIASAALVASAVAPAVSAKDFNDVLENNSHKEAIDALSNAGVISGYPDGSFQPNKTLTRSDVVKLMGKWLVSMGYEIPKDYKTNIRFSDLNANSNDELLQSAAIVREYNVFKGNEKGELDAKGNITRENMAIVLVRAYESVFKTDLLSYVQEQKFDRDVIDLHLAKAEARTAIDVLDFFDITNPAAPNFRPKETTTRAQFASFLYKTIQVKLPEEETPEVPEAAEVTAVQAANEKELTVAGKNLQLLKAEQVKIEDNELASYKANENGTAATIVLKNELVSGKENTLTITTKDDEGEDKVDTFKFTYELKVGEVTAEAAQLNAQTEGQFLTFNIDGKKADLKKLKDAGYTVEFLSTGSNVFKDKATGELNKIAAGADFEYQVKVSKDGKTVTSNLAKVKVVDFASTIADITEVEIVQNGVKVNSGKLSLDESGTVKATVKKAVTLSGVTKDNPAATFTSSNPSIATVSTDGTIKPISPGEVNIVAKVDNVTKNIPLTVVTGKRTAASATVSSADAKLIDGTKQEIDVTVTDQFGDPFSGALTAVSSDETVAAAAVTAVADGAAKLTIDAKKAGSANIQLKADDKVLAAVAASVSDDKQVADRKLETVSAADDLKIDAMAGSKDGKLKLAWKEYNAAGFLVGNNPIPVATYKVESTNTDAATVSKDANGIIEVTAKKAGTTEVQIKQGDIVRASVTITVADSTPKIDAVEFEKTEPVVTESVNMQVVKPEGIKLTSTEFTPQINTAGDIYVENGSTKINLGTIEQSYSGAAADVTGLKIEGGSLKGTVKAGAQGTVVVSVKQNGQTAPVGTQAITVNVPSK